MDTKHAPGIPFAMRRWAGTLEEVARFKARHGKLPGDSGLEPREISLQQWLALQRKKETAGELTQTQVEALDAVDGDWRVNQQRLPWENSLATAILEYQMLGRIPGNDTPLGTWLRQQRSRMSAGKLDEGQLKALDESIPGWRNVDRVRWFEHASSLRRYVEEHGKLPTSRTRDTEGQRLYIWLARQRKRQREDILHPDYAATLDADIPAWRRTPTAGQARPR